VARASFRTIPVAGVAGRHLLVGGFDLVTQMEVGGAVLLDLNGCTCGVGTMRTIGVPDARPLSLHAAARLADNSVLVVGGWTFDAATDALVAEPQAFLLVPDLGLD
jgi:hypothetical protein